VAESRNLGLVVPRPGHGEFIIRTLEEKVSSRRGGAIEESRPGSAQARKWRVYNKDLIGKVCSRKGGGIKESRPGGAQAQKWRVYNKDLIRKGQFQAGRRNRGI
jgi:hypothetical protein